jgi:hypothetical protein
MAVAFERYITVCHPFFKVVHNWSARRYILPILILSIAYNLPKYGELKVVRTLGTTCIPVLSMHSETNQIY